MGRSGHGRAWLGAGVAAGAILLLSSLGVPEPGGCGVGAEDPEDPEAVGRIGEEATATQGIHLQGIHLQGIHLQGIRLQSITLKGGSSLGSLRVDGTAIAGKVKGVPLVLSDATAAKFNGATADAVLRDYDGTDRTVKVRIAGIPVRDSTQNVSAHPSNRSNLSLWRMPLEARLDGATWTNACGDPGTQGSFLAGVWKADGFWSDDPTLVTFVCPTGVVSKCIRSWGYRPWDTLTSAEGSAVLPADARQLHQACVLAAIAGYCARSGNAGDIVSYTQPNTPIDLFDGFHVNVKTVPLPPEYATMKYESTFTASGLVSMTHSRYATALPNCPCPFLDQVDPDPTGYQVMVKSMVGTGGGGGDGEGGPPPL